MYLLVYKGNCASKVIGGVKFTQKRKTVNISENKKHLFVDSNGKSLYSEIDAVKIQKDEVVEDKKSVIEKRVEDLKKKYNLEELRCICDEMGISNVGSKTEISQRIAELENQNKVTDS